MRLKDLLEKVEILNIAGTKDPEIEGIAINSKKVKQNYLFAAICGFKQDGHAFAAEAARMGASAVLVQKILELPEEVTQVVVKNTRSQLPLLCKNFYGSPSRNLVLCGITGTNGKTTTVFLADSIFKSAGLKTSFITTINAEIAGCRASFDRTTPESPDLNNFFRRSVSENVKVSCMEVSSHSIDLYRIDWLDFDFFVFMNLTQDHLDYHGNMENYFEVKKRLFAPQFRQLYGGRGAVINLDDMYGRELASLTDLPLLTYAIEDKAADLRAENILNSIDGIRMDVIFNPVHERKSKFASGINKTKKFSVSSSLCGFFNAYNILAAMATGIIAGVDMDRITEGISLMQGVKGRFERIKVNKNISAIVDYAHTPDGLEKVLRTAKSLLLPGARLISVFGCGGDRDTKKRKIMGNISAAIADFSIITSDNPRTEDPGLIINMIEEGFKQIDNKGYDIEEDRKKAIFKALEMAKENDIVLVAGKGHEDYQEFDGRRVHFSDQEAIRQWSNE